MASDNVIAKLPAELLSLILEKTDKKDHFAQSLVSKKFSHAAQALLFKNIKIRYNDAIPITKLLVVKPDLAKSVQYLTVSFLESGLPARSFESYRSDFNAAKEQEKLVIQHAEGTFMREASKVLSKKVDVTFKWFWLSLLAQDQPDVYLALLLSILPAVTDLVITLQGARSHSMSFLKLALATVVRFSAAQPCNLSPSESRDLMGKLQRLYIQHSSMLNTCSSLGALFAAPCLEDVRVDSWKSPKMPLDIVPATSKMRNIYLDAGALNASFVSALIQGSPLLTNLILGCIMTERINDWFQVVCDAICKRAPTLETLTLVTLFRKATQTMPIRFKTLTGFRKLKNLEIPEPLLLGSPPQIQDRSLFVKTLPSCLETLSLSACTPNELEPLASIAAAGRESFPALKVIFMDFGRVSDVRDDAMNELIKKLVEIADRFKEGMMAHLYWHMRTLYTPAADHDLEQFFQDNEVFQDNV